jgi:hypothetical protein
MTKVVAGIAIAGPDDGPGKGLEFKYRAERG